MTAATESTRDALDEARLAWDEFIERFGELGRAMRTDPRENVQLVAERVEAYMPGFTTFDWGMGMNGDEWLDAIERALDGVDED